MDHSTNVVTLLRRREERFLFGAQCVPSLPRRYIQLSAIMDSGGLLMQGHVILGFSRCGQYLISYQCVLSGQLAQQEYCYSIHWWRFQLFQPVEHVLSYKLFSGEVFERELHIVVAQSSDKRYVIVQGCMQAVDSESTHTCHIAIVTGPQSTLSHEDHPWTTTQLKFDLLPPFPPLLPYLALRIPGCVLLNTGDRLVGLFYDAERPLIPVQRLAYSWLHNQTYSVDSEPGTGTDLSTSSPSQVLPVEVFHEENTLQPSDTKDNGVNIRQSLLDIELWANQALCTELEVMGFNYHCLLDYDLQIIEVNRDSGEVVFGLFTLVEVLVSTGAIDRYSLNVIGLWCVFSGLAKVMMVYPPKLIHGPTSHFSIPAQSLSNALRKKYFLPSHPHDAITAFSNHNVHSGKSLQYLNHPQLPVSIILKRNKSPQHNYY